jgi:erythromycin esterase-like protein
MEAQGCHTALSGKNSREKAVAQTLPLFICNEYEEAFNANGAEGVEPQARYVKGQVGDVMDVAHLEAQAQPPKVVVWAHNSHLGDARATQMGEAGELNLGQLVRQRYGREAVLIGFTTYHGTVTAASMWGGPAEHKRVRPALPDSYEALFHDLGLPRFLLGSDEESDALRALRQPCLERAIGVIYLPEMERISHFFTARLADQFDVVVHFDEARAVEALERTAEWERGRVPETFPSGL